MNFSSRTLKKSEFKYLACKRELLNIVFALKQFVTYISCQKVIVITDRKPLSYLLLQKHLNGLHHAWLETLLEFNFEVIYCSRKFNIPLDLLLRLASDANIKISEPVFALVQTTPSIEFLIDHSRAGRVVLQMGLELADANRQHDILKDVHAPSHFSAKELHSPIIRAGKYWSTLKQDCKAFTYGCAECQKYIIIKRGFHPQKSMASSSPMDHVLLDFLDSVFENNGHK